MIAAKFLFRFLQLAGSCGLALLVIVLFVVIMTILVRWFVDFTGEYMGWNFGWIKQKFKPITSRLPFEFKIKRKEKVELDLRE